MSEIAKCPICGGVPLDKWEVTSVRVFQTGQACCGVDCSTNERWTQYAAAMKAEARHNALVDAVDRLVTSIDEDDVNEYRLARAEVDRLIAEGEG